jgi:hypothetical protein
MSPVLWRVLGKSQRLAPVLKKIPGEKQPGVLIIRTNRLAGKEFETRLLPGAHRVDCLLIKELRIEQEGVG